MVQTPFIVQILRVVLHVQSKNGNL